MSMAQLDIAAARRRPRWAAPAMAAAAAAGVCALAAVVDPYRGEGVPCPFHTITGLWCPICGSSRSLHSLLHGHVAAAFARNPLFVAALPILLWSWLAWTSDAIGGPRLRRVPVDRRVLIGASLVVGAFWVARNLPFGPFRVLGP